MTTCLNTLFASAHIDNNAVSFPEQCSRDLYAKAKKMLIDINGIWCGGKKQHFSFEFDPTTIVERFLSDGDWPKKNPMSFFPTPKNVIEYILRWTEANPKNLAHLGRTVRILEPSAGRGHLAIALRDAYAAAGVPVDITCVELDPVNAIYLRQAGFTVIESDFLTLNAEDIGNFDLVVMNPPFNGTECARHVYHAQQFLDPKRYAVCVLPTSLFKRKEKITKQLCHDASVLNFGEFDECVFDENTFENTTVETMVINMPAGELPSQLVDNVYHYCAESFGYVTANNNTLNALANLATNRADMNAVMDKAIDLAPDENVLYCIDNAIVRERLFNILWDTREAGDSVPVAPKPIETKPLSPEMLEEGFDLMTAALQEISDTLDNIAA
jgi:predicted RNA methylase